MEQRPNPEHFNSRPQWGADPPRPAPSPAALFPLIAALLLLSFLQVMSLAVNHNEGMYVAAGRLALEAPLYGEVVFLQTPLQARLLQILYAVTGPDWLLLKARFLQWFLLAAALGLLAATARAFHIRWIPALLLGFLVLLDIRANGPIKQAANYTLPAGLTLGGLLALRVWADWQGRDMRRRNALATACGLCAGLAISAKLTYLPISLALGVAVVMQGGGWRGIGCFAAGGAMGVLPILYELIRHPEAFWFQNVSYHRMNAAMMENQSGRGFLADKLRWLAHHFRSPLTALTWAALVGAAVWAALQRRDLQNSGDLRSTVLLFIAALIAALLPYPARDEYYFAVLPFKLLLLAVLLPQQSRHWLLGGLILAGAIFYAFSNDWYIIRHKAFHPESWPPVETHQAGQVLAAEVPGTPVVFTYAPLAPLEAGWQVPPELASGPFLTRALPRDAPRGRGTPSVTDLSGYLDQQRPAVLYLTRYAPLEAPARFWAREQGYERREVPGGELWVRPDSANAGD